jgi:hypothetical protein
VEIAMTPQKQIAIATYSILRMGSLFISNPSISVQKGPVWNKTIYKLSGMIVNTNVVIAKRA